jgi:hypothetical protein
MGTAGPRRTTAPTIGFGDRADDALHVIAADGAPQLLAGRGETQLTLAGALPR